GDGTFAAPGFTGVNSDPMALYGADFDNDGDVDAAVYHNQPGTSHLEILRNDGTGTFVLANDYSPAILGQHVSGGDLDADGDVDLVLTDGWGAQNNVKVMTNTGNCTFSGPTSYSAGAWARGVQVTDVDNDGDMDVCVVSEGDGSVTVLYNDGTGAFPHPAAFATGDAPEGLYANDLNGDGWVDLASAQAGDSSVSILLNTGHGTFAPPVAYNTHTAHMTVDGGDLDGDGDVDLCLTAHSTDSVIAIRNNGDGTFGEPSLYRVANTPWSARLADYNLDGALDIAATSYYTNSVCVLLGIGLGLAGEPAGPARLCLEARPSVFRDRLNLTVAGVPTGAVVSIHDVTGRLVRTLAVGRQQSAVSSLVWDGRDASGRRCAAGVYVVRLPSEGGCLTGRAVLTR
ncbi:hypothetical protein FJY71_04330, partial [candidate division WOR-3 bacterium]|nr:hypothetical protein [candidate division WOR-3 bacterium]